MSREPVTLEVNGATATILFDRPKVRNAMTMAMYRRLLTMCERISGMPEIRVIVLRGAGGAFIAGTDIGEFTGFSGGEDGLAYERTVEQVTAAVESLPAPTIAVVDGPAMGGGLVMAAACDFRVISDRARFGVPIARTLGNCLSSRNIARLERNFGLSLTRKMLIQGGVLDAQTALHCGFATQVMSPSTLGEAVDTLVNELMDSAPLTVAATRESIRRLARNDLGDDDLITHIYQSDDFKQGVASFLEKRPRRWTGIPGSLFEGRNQ